MEAYQALARVYDKMMDGQERSLWVDTTISLLKEAGLKPGDSVADLACGTGAISIPLAKAGYKVTALDMSEEMLMEARQQARGVQIAWICQDMTNFVLHRPVKAVNCACDGVNYLTDMQQVHTFFNAVYRALVPGGIFIFDVSTRNKLEAMDGQLYGLDEDDIAYLWRNELDKDTHVLTMDITFFIEQEDGLFERLDELHHQRAHSMQELSDELINCGFALKGIYSGLTDQPACEKDLRHRYVAVKPC